MALQRKTALPRGGGLQRRTPLQAGKPLTRGKALAVKPMKRSRPKPAVPPAVRAEVAARSGGWCEVALPGCAGRAFDVQHRITTKAGGRHGEAKVLHDRLSDLLHSCRLCHLEIHRLPAKAEARGLTVREGVDTSAVPVWTRHAVGAVLLDDAGGWEPAPLAGSVAA
jgi:hypothetical protein